MSDWDDFLQNQLDHDQFHIDNLYLSYQTICTRILDFSCTLCFPDRHPYEYTWTNFRTWFSAQYSVYSYTDNLRRYWTALQVNTQLLNNITYLNAIWQLLFTFRYNRLPPPIDHL